MLAIIEHWFLMFMAYAVLGWTMEVTLKLIDLHRFINRGFLMGPYCPIYGVGGVAISLMLARYSGDPLALFSMGMLLCSVLEYFTSWAMEKLFHARWWDYSQRKFNLNGRICLNTMIPFGLLGLLIIYGINPPLERIIARMSAAATHVLCGILAAGFLTDLVISTNILARVRREAQVLDTDNTEEMTRLVHQALASHGWTYRRLLDAFPNLRHIGHVIAENVSDLRDTMVETTSEALEKLSQSSAEGRAKVEAEIKKLEESHARYEAQFQRRKAALQELLERYRSK